jgi:hypothetical protein
MTAMKALRTVFEIIVTAAALKAALNTLSRPMGGEPKAATRLGHRPGGRLGGRVGPLTVEGYDADPDLDGLEYEDLL